MKKYLVIVLMFLAAGNGYAKDKAAEKNRKAVDNEERQFQKSLRKDKDTSIAYLEHANRLADMSSESSRALGFYKLALKYDSSNSLIYKDYGRYLFDKQRAYTSSKTMLEKSLALAPADEEVKNYLASVNKVLALQDEDAKLKSFGTTSVRGLNTDSNYKAIIKFDSLKPLLASPASKYYYPGLFRRFSADDTTLSPAEMYMMIVGYASQSAYNPFNYNDILEMRMLENHDIDGAIKRGIELTQTNPLNPTLNREIMYCYRKKGELIRADKYLNRIKQYFNGVLYSGDGTCAKPYISLWAKEEYNFITYIGYQSTDNHSMGNCAGLMSENIDMIEPATQKTETVYFNVALIYMQAVGK